MRGRDPDPNWGAETQIRIARGGGLGFGFHQIVDWVGEGWRLGFGVGRVGLGVRARARRQCWGVTLIKVLLGGSRSGFWGGGALNRGLVEVFLLGGSSPASTWLVDWGGGCGYGAGWGGVGSSSAMTISLPSPSASSLSPPFPFTDPLSLPPSSYSLSLPSTSDGSFPFSLLIWVFVWLPINNFLILVFCDLRRKKERKTEGKGTLVRK
ncbi:hypothetical protein TIFTF001_012720 [Ficus carica]|uniref:Transmembrane protein n=1 Tax=Ficus carica TaxID=3494 RepID=A0AA88A294_FICCA|nr:hypothetical protein TIFTF001_012720 [Ficus carica]